VEKSGAEKSRVGFPNGWKINIRKLIFGSSASDNFMLFKNTLPIAEVAF